MARRLTTVLDAWAVEAFLRGEEAGPEVERIIGDGAALISWVNLGEVLYVETRRVGATAAEDAIRALREDVMAEEPSAEIVIAAARRKAAGGISFADCFALATAARHSAPLVTGDPEIIAAAGDVEVVDLRLSE